jgi:hypothetical protein
MFLEGKGCKKDLSKAMEYCSLAFNEGKKEASNLWFAIVTEFIKENGSGNGQNPLQLLLDPSMLSQNGEDEEEEDSKKTQGKNSKKNNDAWKSMYG